MRVGSVGVRQTIVVETGIGEGTIAKKTAVHLKDGINNLPLDGAVFWLESRHKALVPVDPEMCDERFSCISFTFVYRLQPIVFVAISPCLFSRLKCLGLASMNGSYIT